MSPDGRQVAFESEADNLVPGDTNLCDNDNDLMFDDPCSDVFIRAVGPNATCGGAILDAGEDCDPPAGACPSGTACSETCQCNDLTADGDANDTVLEVLDTAVMSPTPTVLCAAGETAVAGGKAAFLRPESTTSTPGCAAGSLNPADADTNDQIVYFWDGTLQELDRPATAVRLSSTHIAALVSEADDGNANYNGDGVPDDLVV